MRVSRIVTCVVLAVVAQRASVAVADDACQVFKREKYKQSDGNTKPLKPSEVKRPSDADPKQWKICVDQAEKKRQDYLSGKTQNNIGSSGSSKKRDPLQCKLACEKQCRSRSPGDACAVSTKQCKKSCER